jgi:hypothetical protein
MARAIKIHAKFCAAPVANEAIVKITMQAIRNRLRPKRSENPAAGRQNDSVCHQIARQHPGSFVISGRKISGDVRQGYCGDRSVEDLHERREHDRHRHQPWIAGALTWSVVRLCRHIVRAASQSVLGKKRNSANRERIEMQSSPVWFLIPQNR